MLRQSRQQSSHLVGSVRGNGLFHESDERFTLLRVRLRHAANNQTADQFNSITTTASATSKIGITALLSVFSTESCGLILAVLRCQRGRVREPCLEANKLLDGTPRRDVIRSSSGALLFRVANFTAWEPTRLVTSLFLNSAGVATDRQDVRNCQGCSKPALGRLHTRIQRRGNVGSMRTAVPQAHSQALPLDV